MTTYTDESSIHPPRTMAFSVKAACKYLGGISKSNFYAKIARRHIEPNPFGTYNREDLDLVRLRLKRRNK